MKKFKIIVKMVVTYVLLVAYSVGVTMCCTKRINQLYNELEEME